MMELLKCQDCRDTGFKNVPTTGCKKCGTTGDFYEVYCECSTGKERWLMKHDASELWYGNE